jgi:Tfp pilus assembly protein PilN
MAGQINLFNPDLLPRKTPLPASLVPWVIGAGMLVCAAVAVWVTVQTHAALAEARLAAEQLSPLSAESQLLQARINSNQPDAQLQVEVRHLERKLQSRQQALTLLEAEGAGGDTGFSQQLRALSHQSMEGLWLTHIEMAGEQLSLQGQTLSADKVPRWMAALRREPSLGGRVFEVFTLVQAASEAPETKPGAAATSVLASPAAPLPYQFVLKGQRDRSAGVDAGKTP